MRLPREQLAGGDPRRLEPAAPGPSRANGAPGRTRMAKPNQLGSLRGVGLGQHQHVRERLEPVAQPPPVAPPRLHERGQLLELARPRPPPACRSSSGCSPRGSTCTCGRSRTAGRRAARRSACRTCSPCPASHQQSRPQSRNDSTIFLSLPRADQHAAALAGRDVVRGIERDRREVAERAGVPAVVGRPERVAVVLDEPQPVLARTARMHRVDVERVAERVGEHHRARAGPDRRPPAPRHRRCRSPGRRPRRPASSPFWKIGLTVVGKPAATVITSSPGHQPAIAQPRRGERRQREQVGRRARVAQERVPRAHEARERRARAAWRSGRW